MNQADFLSDFRNVWNKPNNAVAQIILINAIVFVVFGILSLFIGAGFQRDYFGLPANFGTMLTRLWTWITYQFVHAGFFHVLFNMLWFYWFGKLIQEFLGSKKVVALYLLGGLMGGLAYVLAYNALPMFAGAVGQSTIVGASAGVTATVVGAAVFMPNYTFFLLFFGPVKIKYIALVQVILALMGTGGPNAGGEIAHLGGALMGFGYITQLKQGNDWGAWITNALDWFNKIFSPQSKIKVTHRSGNRSASAQTSKKYGSPAFKSGQSQTSQEEIDLILDKISQSGYESLSKEEKQKLFDASK